MKHLLLFFLIPLTSFLIPVSVPAQERVLLHISPNGEQEVVPLKKGVPVSEILERSKFKTPDLPQRTEGEAGGLITAIKNFDPVADFAKFDHSLHQDVLFQWFVPTAACRVKELWWYNGPTHGLKNAVTIRAWYADPKLAARPSSVVTKFMGAYRDSGDGDGGVTPYRPAAGKNQWFYGNGAPDSATYRFDPLGYEVGTWHAGTGRTVTVDSAGWQHIVVQEVKDSITAKLGQLFGFTIANPAVRGDNPAGQTEIPLDINGFPNTLYPRHSLKFYENGWTDTTKRGWYLRGDYEWGMYVVVEYTGDRPPTITTSSYGTTLKTTPRLITATVTDDNPGGGQAGVKSVRLFAKKGIMASYDSTLMAASGNMYSGSAPAGAAGDTVFWYIVATDVNGNRTKSLNFFFKIFKITQGRLLIYNNAQYSLATAALIYTNSSAKYDRWSGPNDGIGELPELLSHYPKVLLADGAFPARNVYPAVANWLKQANGSVQRNLFFASQDYGSYITPGGGDTTFAAGTFENMLGVQTLGPQDQGPTNRPMRVIPQDDSFTSQVRRYCQDSSVTLWHDPTFELAFSAYPDFLTKTGVAKTLFTDGTGTNIMGVRNQGTGFQTVFLALDAGALQFRSDTSLHNSTYTTVTDPKYMWLTDVIHLPSNLFEDLTDVNEREEVLAADFRLEGNYPNPFNPTTTIRYSLGARTSVTLTIYNTLGQSVATLVNTTQDAGPHTVEFNAARLASGLYFYRLQAGTFTTVKKMVVMK